MQNVSDIKASLKNNTLNAILPKEITHQDQSSGKKSNKKQRNRNKPTRWYCSCGCNYSRLSNEWNKKVEGRKDEAKISDMQGISLQVKWSERAATLQIATTSVILDSGCTSHVFTPSSQVNDIQPVNYRDEIYIPTGKHATTYANAHIYNLEKLTNKAKKVKLVRNFAKNLLSCGQFCNDRCTFVLTN